MSRRAGDAQNEYQTRILETLNQSLIPMDVENIRIKTGLKNWESTKAILLEMVLQGKINGQKTTKSWIFWSGDGVGVRPVRKRQQQLTHPI